MNNDLPQRLSDAAVEFLVALRMKEGLKQDLYDDLVAVLEECAIAWKDQDCIPRLAVSAMVGIEPGTQAAAAHYPSPAKEQIYDASFRLNELINDCVT